MASERWVVLGVAPVRATWFTELARWATAGIVPIEFVKCLSTDEVASRLRSGRAFSALLVDAHAAGLDRDLLAQAAASGCTPIVVADGPTPWTQLEDVASIDARLDRAELLATLRRHGRPVDDVTAPRATAGPAVGPWRGRLVVVTGVPGTGCSTVAVALAEGLAQDPRRRGTLALADLALHADLGVLHDAREVAPALQELVEAHRGGPLGPSEVRALLFVDPRRGYDLLLGLRRHHDWAALRPRAVAAAVDGLRQAYRLVVAEVDADVEGEADTGSLDVEERNALARVAVTDADVVVVVSRPDVRGVHRLADVLTSLLALGVEGPRLQPVVVGTPRGRRARAEVTAAVAGLTVVPAGASPCPSPVHVPRAARLGRLVHDGLPLPATLGRPVVRAVEAALDRLDPVASRPEAGAPVVPGTVGHRTDAEAHG